MVTFVLDNWEMILLTAVTLVVYAVIVVVVPSPREAKSWPH